VCYTVRLKEEKSTPVLDKARHAKRLEINAGSENMDKDGQNPILLPESAVFVCSLTVRIIRFGTIVGDNFEEK
jgi:hypothetical protein